MKRWFAVALIVLLLGGAIYWRLEQKKAQEGQMMGMGGGPGRGGGFRGPASVELAPVQYRDIIKTFEATGTVESVQNIKISPKVTGRIEFLQAQEGDHVTRGKVLVRLDPTELQAGVNQAKANLAEAKSRLAQAQITMSTIDASVRTQIQQQEANLAQAKFRLEQARLTQPATDTSVKSQISQQEAALASAESDLRQTQATRAATIEASKASIEDAQSKVDNASAIVANATAGVKSAQANLDNATTKYNRILDLYKQGYVAAQDVDDAKTAMSVQQSTVETANGQLRSATAAQASTTAQKKSVEQQANISRAKVDADVDAATAKVTQAKAALDYARASAAQSPAYQQNLAALQAAVDAAKANLDYARANARQSPAYQQNIAALQAGMEAARASLDSAKSRLSDTVLVSPLDGVVTARNQDQGALATPSQPILTVQSANQLWVTIGVPENISVNVHLNQPATVVFDALNGRSFTARVAQINPSANLDSRQFTVRVVLDNASKEINPGMFARVTLVTQRADHVLTVPQEAIEQDPAGGNYVTVAGKDQKAHRRIVVTGIQDANWVAITTGLQVGEKVVTMSAMPLRDGQPIRAGGDRRGQRGKGRPGSGSGQGYPGAGEPRSGGASPERPDSPKGEFGQSSPGQMHRGAGRPSGDSPTTGAPAPRTRPHSQD